jgi:hypothetical protein
MDEDLVRGHQSEKIGHNITLLVEHSKVCEGLTELEVSVAKLWLSEMEECSSARQAVILHQSSQVVKSRHNLLKVKIIVSSLSKA